MNNPKSSSMDGSQVYLSIVATFDPSPGVMASFYDEVMSYAVSAPFFMELIVVNGFAGKQDDADYSPVDKEGLMIRIVSVPSGQGQGGAILHGIALAKGDIIVSIDPDMYHNVGDIAHMLACHQKGSQVVFSRRVSRVDIGYVRSFFSWVFNLVLRGITGSGIKDFNSPFFLISKEVVIALLRLNVPVEAYKFCMYFFYKDKFSQIEIASERLLFKAKSNYSYASLIKLFFIRLKISSHYSRFS